MGLVTQKNYVQKPIENPIKPRYLKMFYRKFGKKSGREFKHLGRKFQKYQPEIPEIDNSCPEIPEI